MLVLIAAGFGGLAWLTMQLYARRHVTLAFAPAGSVVPALELTFFPDQLAFTTPSPPPALGQLHLDGATSVTVGSELVPGHGLVRYRGAGAGAGFVYVELGEPLPAVPLRPGISLCGCVGERVPLWCFGGLAVGMQPVAGAEVTVMGGGEHGIDLATALTDSSGSFTIDGIDGALDGLGLRVRAKGFAIAHQWLGRIGDGTRTFPVIALARTRARPGRVVVPGELDATRLRVLARGLPGVEATPAPDGTFVLDHVPPGITPGLLVYGLAPTWTHLPASAFAGSPIELEVVPAAVLRGRVLDAASARPLAGALVYCGDQAAVRTGGDGCFELARLLPGDVDIEAMWDFVDSRRRRTPWFGRRRVVLQPGEHPDRIDILVTAR